MQRHRLLQRGLRRRVVAAGKFGAAGVALVADAHQLFVGERQVARVVVELAGAFAFGEAQLLHLAGHGLLARPRGAQGLVAVTLSLLGACQAFALQARHLAGPGQLRLGRLQVLLFARLGFAEFGKVVGDARGVLLGALARLHQFQVLDLQRMGALLQGLGLLAPTG